MAGLFPQVTESYKLEEPPLVRRFSMSVVGMALVTGVALRLLRAGVLTRGPNESLLYVGAMFVLGLGILLGMVALHLGNYTIRHWLWRAPTFAAIEALAEALTSLVLIALHSEPTGSARATMDDWPSMAIGIFFWRITTVLVFAALLAGVVQLVRYQLLKRQNRAHTFEAVSQEVTAQHRAAEGRAKRTDESSPDSQP